MVLPLPAPPWMTTTPASGRGDQLELPRIDERGDLGQVPVHPLAAAGLDAEAPFDGCPGRTAVSCPPASALSRGSMRRHPPVGAHETCPGES